MLHELSCSVIADMVAIISVYDPISDHLPPDEADELKFLKSLVRLWTDENK